MKGNFKVGDKVRVKKFDKRPWGWNSRGMMDHLMGQVVEVKDISTCCNMLFIWDETHNTTWLVEQDEVEPVNECIMIYRKGSEVIALNKCTGETAKAKCNPSDEFDFMTGAKLAFDRLTAKPKYYSGKIIFTKGDDVFKTGRIYEIKDGRIESPMGGLLPYDNVSFVDLNEVKDYFTATRDRKRKKGWSCNTLEFIEVHDD